MSKKEYMRLSGCDDPWYCRTCVIPFFLDSFFDDTSSNGSMHQTENRSSHGEAVDHSDECEHSAQQYPKDLGVIHYNLPNSMNSESPIDRPFKLICLSETWLNADVSDDDINLPGYSIARKDCVRRIGGGVAIHYLVFYIVIEVQVPKGKSILVSCVYIPPKEVNHYTLAHLSATMEKCLDYKFACLGSNYDQLSLQSMELVTMCRHYHLDQLIIEPTRITTQSQSLLDVVLTTKSELICDSGVLLHSMSDHSAIYCFRKSSLKNQPRYHILTEIWISSSMSIST